MSAENGGKPLGGRGSAAPPRTPLAELTALLRTPWREGAGVAALSPGTQSRSGLSAIR